MSCQINSTGRRRSPVLAGAHISGQDRVYENQKRNSNNRNRVSGFVLANPDRRGDWKSTQMTENTHSEVVLITVGWRGIFAGAISTVGAITENSRRRREPLPQSPAWPGGSQFPRARSTCVAVAPRPSLLIPCPWAHRSFKRRRLHLTFAPCGNSKIGTGIRNRRK